jgi:hypothetical protein
MNTAPHVVHAENFATASENRIHSDEIAKKYGFHGALVPGVTVYGYLTHPLVEQFGTQWLGHSVADLRLLKPTYDGERVRVEMREAMDGYVVEAFDEDGQLLATLTSAMPQTLPETEDLALLDGSIKHPERVEISWGNVSENEVFAPWTVTLSAEENSNYTLQAKDEIECYSDVVHPHYLLSLANTALMQEYVMPAWIHVGSESRHRALLNTGDTITVRPVTLAKWQKKGHEFIRLYVTFWRDDELTTDILHTAIFKVAE